MKHLWLMLAALALPASAQSESAPPADPALEEDGLEAPPPSGTKRTQRTRANQPALRFGVDDFLIEAGALPDAPEAQSASTLRASGFVLWQASRNWEWRLGARVDGQAQQGGAQPYSRWQADLTDTYARYRDGDTRLTLGAQTVIWGRVDAVPLIDRVSRADLTRFVLDDLANRRLAQPALRWEQTLGDYKLDTVLLPAFLGAKLPDLDSVWSPINRLTGEVIGLPPSPALAALVRSASIDQDDGGFGGGAVRLARTGVAPVDFGFTLARTRQSLPYYLADPAGLALTAIHPYNTFAGIDAEFVTGGMTWRSELGVTDGQPATLPGGRSISVRSLDWVGALEYFPGGSDTRVNLQVVAHRLHTSQAVLELDEYYGVNGEIETKLAQGRWKLSARFFSGLNVRDVHVAPMVSYLGWEPHEFFAVARYFDGENRTLGGFHRNHSMLAVGFRTRF